jgi:hypothetical protein
MTGAHWLAFRQAKRWHKCPLMAGSRLTAPSDQPRTSAGTWRAAGTPCRNGSGWILEKNSVRSPEKDTSVYPEGVAPGALVCSGYPGKAAAEATESHDSKSPPCKTVNRASIGICPLEARARNLPGRALVEFGLDRKAGLGRLSSLLKSPIRPLPGGPWLRSVHGAVSPSPTG